MRSTADFDVRVDYETALPAARLVYTPERVAAARAARDGDAGEGPSMPPYLVELHNRMAAITE